MHPFEVLADPVRRRIVELLGPGEVTAGGVGEVIGAEFGISQPAVSQHLKVLREAGFVLVRAEASRRYYRVARDALADAGSWFDRFRDPFAQPLDALATELARGRSSAHRRSVSGSDSRGADEAGGGDVAAGH